MSAAELPHEAYVAAIASLDGVGPARLRWLLGMGAPGQVWERVVAGRLPAGPSAAAVGVDSAMRSKWVAQAAQLSPARVWHRCGVERVGVVTLGAPGYPPSLADDPEPPVILFHRGDPDVLVGPSVALVGTRRATGYGRKHAHTLGRDLTAAGVSVVSGLALGIDAAAHAGAVQAHGAPPIAVVGAGLDAPCPRRNRPLAETVAELGVLVSEVPPGVPASPWRFPVRNRVIAALADAVVVVESAGAGGSMHTVREAMLRDRPVLALPGPIDSRVSEGTNQLISEGALVCTGVDDVLGAIGHVAPRGDAVQPELPLERRAAPTGDAASVLDEIGWRPVSVEQLARGSGLDFAPLSAALARLEAEGWIERDGAWIERVARVGRIPGSTGRGA